MLNIAIAAGSLLLLVAATLIAREHPGGTPCEPRPPIVIARCVN